MCGSAGGCRRLRAADVVPRVVLAPNAFKGALDAPAAAEAMRAGVLAADPGAEPLPVPMADGGDGTAAVLCAARGGRMWRRLALDPWGRPRRARFALLPDGTAVVDVASASGLGRRRPGPAEARAASTRGTGELVREALACGARRVWVALGGSATTDGGAGLLTALGAAVRDRDGGELPPGGAALVQAAAVDLSGLQWLRGVEFEALVDVDHPLLGPRGAARVFAPQKGAATEDLPLLERGLQRWAELLEAATGRRCRDLPGAGAAGGTGFGLAVALGARLRPGARRVAELVGLPERLRSAWLVLTGEGALDGQTAGGKAPAVVAALAARAGVPCCALVGCLGPGWEVLDTAAGLTAVFCLAPGPRGRTAALRQTAADLTRTAAMATRLYLAGRRAPRG